MIVSRTSRNFNIQWTNYQSTPTVSDDRELGFPFGVDGAGNVHSAATPGERLSARVAQLLLTAPGERRMRPNYGTDIRKMVFKGVTADELQTLIATDMNIRQAIRTYAPEVTYLKVKAEASDPLEGVVTLAFSVAGNGPDLAVHRSEVTLG